MPIAPSLYLLRGTPTIRSHFWIVAMITLRPDPVDDELFSLMRRAGIVFVAVGSDTLANS
ncbi:MAG: hypothetical protein ABSF61_14405 [Anaerolineales bacterium]|jgi:hypothetical protein